MDLVNAPHLPHVPGRKSESKEGQWRQSWHTGGVLSGAFRPAAEMCALRAYVRHRAMWLASRAAPSQHMQKALHQMHGPLTQVLTDITGVTGLAIMRAIVAGERDPVPLARWREPQCASRTEDIAQAVTGPDQPEPVFALKQALALYAADPAPVRACDGAIAPRFQALKPVGTDALPPLHWGHTHRTHPKHAPGYEARGMLSQRTGVDFIAIPGLNASTVPTILSEIGVELRQWPAAKACCAWLGLAPHHELSGGKIVRRSTLKPHNRAGQAFRRAAPARRRRQNSLGAFYRRMRARLGPKAAIVATAHQIARLVYDLLTQRTPFRDLSAAAYEQRTRDREIAALRTKATRFGCTLVESPAYAPGL